MTNSDLNEESTAVQAHVTIMQGIIQRMAENSRSCKVWCVTLVSAVLVVVSRTENPEYALIALVPTLMFLFLDTYYLALERAFRGSYNAFVEKLHGGGLTTQDLYEVAPAGMGLGLAARCLGSVSIWPFYPVLAAVVLVAWQFMGL